MNLKENIAELNKLLNGLETIEESEIVRKYRRSDYVYMRAIVAYYLRKKGYSLTHIGDLMKRTHATIINLLKYANHKSKNHKFDIVVAVIDGHEIARICPFCKHEIKIIKN